MAMKTFPSDVKTRMMEIEIKVNEKKNEKSLNNRSRRDVGHLQRLSDTEHL